ncbi:MAG: growth inhibitor PemK [Glycocaulis sp.]
MSSLAVETAGGDTVVTVAPITHSPPRDPEAAIEIPAATRRRLGLDGERSWIIAADLNRFIWPGTDLRPVSPGSGRFVYGLIPGSLHTAVKERVLALAKAGKLGSTARHP